MKPTISNADNAIESFMLLSVESEAPDDPGTHGTFDATLSRPIRSAIGRLTTARSPGLLQTKGASGVRGASLGHPPSPSAPAPPPAGPGIGTASKIPPAA